jgi:hypothetical protein
MAFEDVDIGTAAGEEESGGEATGAGSDDMDGASLVRHGRMVAGNGKSGSAILDKTDTELSWMRLPDSCTGSEGALS